MDYEIEIDKVALLKLMRGEKVLFSTVFEDVEVRLSPDAIQNPLAECNIVFVAKDGTKHGWPCEEHKGMVIHAPEVEAAPFNSFGGMCCK